jgi:hypothetical protein
VKRDGWRLADRVMFLGWPAGSFAVERVRHFDDKRREAYDGLRRKSPVMFKYDRTTGAAA